jgi:hypothetical protein
MGLVVRAFLEPAPGGGDAGGVVGEVGGLKRQEHPAPGGATRTRC